MNENETPKVELDSILTAKLINRRSMFEDGSSNMVELSFPATEEEVKAALEHIGAVTKSEYRLTQIQSGIYNLIKHIDPQNDLDELNYFAAKVSALPNESLKIFSAAVAAEKYCRSVKDLINLTDSLDNFELLPSLNEEQYGEYQIETYQENTSDVTDKLSKSENVEERWLAEYVELLESTADYMGFGSELSAREQGKFTEYGYIRPHSYNPIVENYHGVQDIPAEYLVSGFNEPQSGAKTPFEINSATPEPVLPLLRVDVETAKSILSLGYADVYRVSDKGAKKLNPLDAINPQVWLSGKYTLAIRQEDSAAIDRLETRESEERGKIKITMKKQGKEER